jgi:hypothetical protein
MEKKKKKTNDERIAEAIDYRLQGHRYDEIAEQMGVNADQARELVHAGLLSIVRENWREQLIIDLQRIDQMLAAIYSQAANGDTEAIRTVIVLRREREIVQRQFERQASFELFSPPNVTANDEATDGNPESGAIQAGPEEARRRRTRGRNAE